MRRLERADLPAGGAAVGWRERTRRLTERDRRTPGGLKAALEILYAAWQELDRG